MAPVFAAAQQPADTAKPAPPPSPPAAAVSIPVDFSGVLYANFQYQGAKGPSKSQNKFDLERAYLTFRMPAGDRASIRITADVFQQTSGANNADAFYKGWVVRAKYAYLQYDLIKSASWNANIRGGLVHTVVIDHQETPSPYTPYGIKGVGEIGIVGVAAHEGARLGAFADQRLAARDAIELGTNMRQVRPIPAQRRR